MSEASERGSAADPPHVAICVATYRRPERLRKLIESLDAMRFSDVEPRVTLVIADNDPENPAAQSDQELAKLTRWPLIYVMEPVRGIVAARNRTLDSAPADADLIAFLDDDEIVQPGWLDAMIKTWRTTGATAVQGPVVPEYETPPPAWIDRLRIFDRGPFRQGQRLKTAATNNSIVDAAFVRDHGLRFCPEFNDSGGEDEEFYGRLQDAGGCIFASSDGVVLDMVPQNRVNLHWALRRNFRRGNTLGRIALLRRRGRLVRFIKGFGAMGWGGATLIAGAFSPSRRVAGMIELCRGAGMLAAFANVRFAEYSKAAVDRDRETGG